MIRPRALARAVAGTLALLAAGAVAAPPALVIDGTTLVRPSGATRVVVPGDLLSHGHFLATPGSAVVLVGYGTPLVQGVETFADLTLALHGTATLGNTAGVAGRLTLGTGRLSLAGHDLAVNAITGGSAASYVVTPDTLGRLVRSASDSADVAFPVGNATYDPLSIRTSGPRDDFRVAVTDVVPPGGFPAGTALTRAWAIGMGRPAGANGLMVASVQWNANEQEASFDRSLTHPTSAVAWRRLGSTWVVQPGVRRSDNGLDPAVDTLIFTAGGLWTLAGAAGLTGVEPPATAGAPRELELSAPSPSPLRGPGAVRYGLPHEANVTLELFAVSGERIATLASGHQPPGWHVARLDPARTSGGVYFLRLTAAGITRSRKVVVMP